MSTHVAVSIHWCRPRSHSSMLVQPVASFELPFVYVNSFTTETSSVSGSRTSQPADLYPLPEKPASHCSVASTPTPHEKLPSRSMQLARASQGQKLSLKPGLAGLQSK